MAGQLAFLSAIGVCHEQLRRQLGSDSSAQERDALTVWRPRDGARHVGNQQSGRAAKKRHTPDLPRRSVRLTNEVDRCAIRCKRGAEERHASLRWHNPHVVRGRRLTNPQAGVVAIALHVGDVSPVRRDRRPLRIAARCQLRDLEIGKRCWLDAGCASGRRSNP